MSDFLWGLENSGWLKHIKAILDAGVFILRVIRISFHSSVKVCYTLNPSAVLYATLFVFFEVFISKDTMLSLLPEKIFHLRE